MCFCVIDFWVSWDKDKCQKRETTGNAENLWGMPKWTTGNAENLRGMPKWIDNVLLTFRSKLIGLVTLPLTHLVHNVLKQARIMWIRSPDMVLSYVNFVLYRVLGSRRSHLPRCQLATKRCTMYHIKCTYLTSMNTELGRKTLKDTELGRGEKQELARLEQELSSNHQNSLSSKFVWKTSLKSS